METVKYFTASDGKRIRVIVNSAPKNKRAVLIVHGLRGGTDMSMFYNAAMKFPRAGVDVWRIELYGWHKKARRMDKVSWHQMMGDIETVLKKMTRVYPSVSVIGHSLGGAQTVYVKNNKIKHKVLWDPSQARNKKEYNMYEAQGRSNYPDYVKQLKVIHDYYWYERNKKKLPASQPPMLVIRASMYERLGWVDHVIPAKLKVIKNADHCFTQGDGKNQRELFGLTLRFIKAGK